MPRIWNQFRNVWRPENFHFHSELARAQQAGPSSPRTDGNFEGWYVKLVDREGQQPYALIPGVFLGNDPHAFIQVLDGRKGTAAYHRFSIDDFSASEHEFEVSIADNRFSRTGIHLAIEAEHSTAKQGIQGDIRFGDWRPWPVTRFSPGIMGPFSFVPFMQCNHGILSLDHGLEGSLSSDQGRTEFDGGRGYVEKDWGRAFPEGYVWVHSNHFEQPGVSLTAAVATIPWLTGEFRGYIIGLLVDGELHRFTTYNGGELEALTMTDRHLHLVIRNRTHRLAVQAEKTEGAILHAPYEKQMIERVAETMMSVADVRLTRVGRSGHEEVVFEERGRSACLEAVGNLDAILSA